MKRNAKLRTGIALGWVGLCAGWALAAETPLPFDSRIVAGQLENGLTYMVRRHDNPPGRLSLLLHVSTGSLNETNEQKGLAHFIEHMAFNGTEHFAAGELVAYFESIGMQFGADLNAFTSFEQTAYMLFIPETDEPHLDKAMMCLSDFGCRVLLESSEIEKERGVILEEKRSGMGPDQRIRDQFYPKLFPGSRMAARMPIGDEKIIQKASREEFLDYYRKWYRPENMTVLAVGDADPQAVIAAVGKWFGQCKSSGPASPPEGAGLKPTTQERAILVSDPEVTTAQVQLIRITEKTPPLQTEEAFRADLVENIGTWIFNRRLSERLQTGAASYQSAAGNVSNFLNDVAMASASASGEPSKWAAILEEMIVEVRRAVKHGFTESELELARSELKDRAERALRTESTQPSRSILMHMNRSLVQDSTLISAQTRLDLAGKFLPMITAPEIHDTFKEYFGSGPFTYALTMPQREDFKLPSEEEILTGARAAQAKETEAIAEKEGVKSILEKEPEPGKVVEKTKDADLDITSAWLSNGIRVHHRFMDYRKDQVFVSLVLAGGEIEETTENRGVTEAASLIGEQPATSRLSSTNTRDLFTGKSIRFDAASRQDHFFISITGSPKDLEAGLQLAHAVLTDGKIEESALKVWSEQTVQFLELAQKYPQAQLSKTLAEVLGGGDLRVKPLEIPQVQAITLLRAQTWLDRLAHNAPMEVAVVGDISLDDALPLVEKYLGSLPKRQRSAAYVDALRKLKRGEGPFGKSVDVETQTPQAFVFSGFLSNDARNTMETRALRLAANVLTTRFIKTLREDKQLVYSISANNVPSEVYEDSGTFFAVSPADPLRVDELKKTMEEMYADFAANGPTAEELEVARKQVLTEAEERLKEPATWWTYLQQLDYKHRSLDDLKNVPEKYNAITVEMIKEIFAKYDLPKRRFWASVHPVAPAATTQPAGGAATPADTQPSSAPATQPAK